MTDSRQLITSIGINKEQISTNSKNINNLIELVAGLRKSVLILEKEISSSSGGGTIIQGGGGVSDFLSLSDTPASFASAPEYLVAVNANTDALEFIDPNTIIPAPFTNENYTVEEYTVTSLPSPALAPVVLATSGAGDTKINARLNITCYNVANVSSNTQQLTVDVSAQSVQNSQIVVVASSFASGGQFMDKLFFQQNGSVLELCFNQVSSNAIVVVRMSHNADTDSGNLSVSGTNSLVLPTTLTASTASNPTTGDECDIRQVIFNTSNGLEARNLTSRQGILATNDITTTNGWISAQGNGVRTANIRSYPNTTDDITSESNLSLIDGATDIKFTAPNNHGTTDNAINITSRSTTVQSTNLTGVNVNAEGKISLQGGGISTYAGKGVEVCHGPSNKILMSVRNGPAGNAIPENSAYTEFNRPFKVHTTSTANLRDPVIGLTAAGMLGFSTSNKKRLWVNDNSDVVPVAGLMGVEQYGPCYLKDLLDKEVGTSNASYGATSADDLRLYPYPWGGIDSSFDYLGANTATRNLSIVDPSADCLEMSMMPQSGIGGIVAGRIIGATFL